MKRLKKFLDVIGSVGAKIIQADGFFFVVLTILNAPIIFFASDLKVGAINFWLGAFAILIFTSATHLLPLKLRRPIQAVLMILFAAHFVTDIFLLYKFDMPLNLDALQILLGTNPLTAKAFLQEQVANFKVLGGLTAFVLVMTALIFGLKKFFATRSEKLLKRFTFNLLIIFSLPTMIYRRI